MYWYSVFWLECELSTLNSCTGTLCSDWNVSFHPLIHVPVLCVLTGMWVNQSNDPKKVIFILDFWGFLFLFFFVGYLPFLLLLNHFLDHAISTLTYKKNLKYFPHDFDMDNSYYELVPRLIFLFWLIRAMDTELFLSKI